MGVWENAEDALKQITRLQPDVVLMDIILPGMTGIEATAQLKEKFSEMEVIMLTAYDDHATGVMHVLVNGQAVLLHGEHTGAQPGRFVRGPGWRMEPNP